MPLFAVRGYAEACWAVGGAAIDAIGEDGDEGTDRLERRGSHLNPDTLTP